MVREPVGWRDRLARLRGSRGRLDLGFRDGPPTMASTLRETRRPGRWTSRLEAAGAAALLFLAPSARAADTSARVGRLLDEAREGSGAPAMAIAVVRAGETVALAASGLADREAGRPATPDTVFPAASVSTLLTAVLVMRQVERGRLELDAPVNRYLEDRLQVRDARGAAAPATLRQLLTHTSGLPVSWSGIHFDPGDPPVGLEDHLATVLRLIRRPGERIVYSNDAFALLGFLAARGEGEDFETHARRTLLEPLGMSSSSFTPGPGLRARLAAAYGAMGPRSGRERTVHADVGAVAPAGGLVTTAGDLARFVRLVLEEGAVDGVRILEPASVREMLRLHARAHPDLAEGFGLGFGVREGPGRQAALTGRTLPLRWAGRAAPTRSSPPRRMGPSLRW